MQRKVKQILQFGGGRKKSLNFGGKDCIIFNVASTPRIFWSPKRFTRP